MQDKQPIAVILGVHRSGTSLIANFMNAIGVDLGQELLPADEWNAAGYWESRKIYETHEKIMKELNFNWHNLPLPLPAKWWHTSSIRELKGELAEFVRSECERTDKIWGFKDPRTAILLPLWQEIFDELQLEPLYVLSVRHPGSVASSLARRDRLALVNSQALWLKTYLYALSHTRNHHLAVVDYDRWFESGLEQARTVVEYLNLSQSVSDEQIASAVNHIIQPGLRHHSSEQYTIYWPLVASFYSMLRQATIDGKVSDEIWTLTETFEKATDLLNIWDDLIKERDKVIANYNKRLRKQRQRHQYSYAIIIFIFALMIYTFIRLGSYSWLK